MDEMRVSQAVTEQPFLFGRVGSEGRLFRLPVAQLA